MLLEVVLPYISSHFLHCFLSFSVLFGPFSVLFGSFRSFSVLFGILCDRTYTECCTSPTYRSPAPPADHRPHRLVTGTPKTPVALFTEKDRKEPKEPKRDRKGTEKDRKGPKRTKNSAGNDLKYTARQPQVASIVPADQSEQSIAIQASR